MVLQASDKCPFFCIWRLTKGEMRVIMRAEFY